VAPIAPAVGVDEKLPPSPIVLGLKMMTYTAPTMKLSLTPYEDPTHYNLPSTTKRNYQGHWPSATSKMLLDLTATKGLGDIQAGHLSWANVPHVLVIAGDNDRAVPLTAIESVYAALQSEQKQLLVIPKAYDLLFQSKPAKNITNALFDWIEQALTTVAS
jgi:fermentation-respiration switch protein FrsA (DUF1100 family)